MATPKNNEIIEKGGEVVKRKRGGGTENSNNYKLSRRCERIGSTFSGTSEKLLQTRD